MVSVVAALIIHKDSFLVTQRSKGECAGLWEFPGGKIEPEETKHNAIIREINEELNIDIRVINIISEFNHIYPSAEISLTLLKCEMKDINQKIKSDGSHTDFKWIKMPQADLLKFAPLDEKIIEFLKNKPCPCPLD